MNILNATLAAVCLSATSAAAIPVNWAFDTVNSVTGNGTRGSFDYNSVTNVYSNISVNIIHAGVPASGVPAYDVQAPFLFSNLSTSTFQSLAFSSLPVHGDRSGSAFVRVQFAVTPAQLLTGGTFNGFFAQTYCKNSDCSQVYGETLGFSPITGTPVAAVPVPAGGALLLSALGLVGWRFGRRTRVTPMALA